MMIAGAHEATDVIVVGAGPAGASTSLLLARAGFAVLLLDRRTFPRAKACGDCISAGANVVLERMGLLPEIRARPHAELRGWRIVAPNGASFNADFPPTADAGCDRALSVERQHFDGLLLTAATHAGVRFMPDIRVTDVLRNAAHCVIGVSTQHGPLHARLVIGADGLRSVVATQLNAVRRAPRLKKLSLTVHVPRAIVQEPIGEMHVGDGFCVGIAPVTNNYDRCNVSVVALSDRYGRVAATDARAFMSWAAGSLPRLRRRMHASDFARAQILASGPFDRPMRTSVFDGAALVGDAAGYYDPFTGQGVYQALVTAELLADVAAVALRNGAVTRHSLARYATERALLLRAPRLVQRAIEHVLARPALANRAIARIARAPAFAHALIGVTGDVQPAQRLLSPRTLSSLLFLRS